MLGLTFQVAAVFAGLGRQVAGRGKAPTARTLEDGAGAVCGGKPQGDRLEIRLRFREVKTVSRTCHLLSHQGTKQSESCDDEAENE
jgi:hypothetical protein